MKRCFFLGLILFNLLAAPFAFGQEDSPAIKAWKIAKEQPHLRALFQKLEKEAGTIATPEFRQYALSTLKGPAFTVISAHREHEAEIINQLKKESLLDDRTAYLFPKTEPIPFLAAPGSTWPGHHSYPGGLVYHTYTNLRMALRYAETYQEIYGVQLRLDYLRLAAILHDAAKTITIPWNTDGSCAKEEISIAGTAAHHIFAVAEAVFRKYPSDLIVTLASAHSPAFSGQPLSTLIGYLKAAAIIAEMPYTSAGLTSDGRALASRPPIESFVNHLVDHDYVLTETSVENVDHALRPEGDYWKRDEILSKTGDLLIYQKLGP